MKAVLLLIGLIIGSIHFAEAQQPKKTPRLGFLRSGSADDAKRYGEVLREGLRDLGYVDGQNITIIARAADQKYERLPQLATELVELNVDVIVAGGTPAIRAAKQVTRSIPIVMAVSTDPVRAGLVASLAQPGGNVTGLSLGTGEEFAGKWVELLKEASPQLSQITALQDSAADASILEPIVRETKRAAEALGLKLRLIEVDDAQGLERAFQSMKTASVKALMVLPSPGFNARRKRSLIWQPNTGYSPSTNTGSLSRREGSCPTVQIYLHCFDVRLTTSIAL
jgi:putative ABC transport system substrate-binding protein